MSRNYSKYIGLLHFTGDLIILNLVFLYLCSVYELGNTGEIFENSVIINISWLFLLGIYRPYSVTRLTQIRDYIFHQFGLLFIFYVLFNILIVILSKGYSISTSIQLPLLGLLLSLSIWKTALFLILNQYRRQGFNFSSMVIVGYGRATKDLERIIKNKPRYGYRFLGYFDDKYRGHHSLGRISDLQRYCMKNHVDEIYCCIPYFENKELKEIIDFAEDNQIYVRIISDFGGYSVHKIAFNKIENIPVISINFSPLHELFNKVVKRGFDILISSLFILLTVFWLFPLISFLIIFDSKGPGFLFTEENRN